MFNFKYNRLNKDLKKTDKKMIKLIIRKKKNPRISWRDKMMENICERVAHLGNRI